MRWMGLRVRGSGEMHVAMDLVDGGAISLGCRGICLLDGTAAW